MVLSDLIKSKHTYEEQIFLVFNTACFGDVLVCNSLCQNIKRLYPNSKIVFITDKPFYEVALNQKDVDEVIIYDKKGEHKGIKGFFKFLKNFKYKNAFAAIITYQNTRNFWISFLSRAKHIIRGKKLSLETDTAQKQILNLLKKLTKEKLTDAPIIYEPQGVLPQATEAYFQTGKEYIALCCLTKDSKKDIPLQTAAEIINNLSDKYEIIYTGVGENNLKYAKALKEAGCRFIDMANKTSINDLALVLKKCKGLISADTGTMHLGYALKTPTVAVFYNQNKLRCWAPNQKLYNTITVASNQTAANITSALEVLIENPQNKMSIVIPTLQKNTELLINLLKILEKDNAVDEIILIDNSGKGLEYTSSKLKLIIPKSNIYVNPAWNYGIAIAKNPIVGLLNDDITISPNFCSEVAQKMNYKMGAVGACAAFLNETQNIVYSVDDTHDLKFSPVDLITHHWGVSIFFFKCSYINIPQEIKIFRGDDWIFYQNKNFGRQNYYIVNQPIYHYGSLTSRSKALRPIGRKDRYFYRKYTKKWYQHIFDWEELADCYRLTFFGLKIMLYKNTKNSSCLL